jgi:hypothetical protein
LLEILFDTYDLLIDEQCSEWDAIRRALLFAAPVPTLAFILFSVPFLLAALGRWISL